VTIIRCNLWNRSVDHRCTHADKFISKSHYLQKY